MKLKDVLGSFELQKGMIGIEVEMEGRSLPERVDGWATHTDGSLRGFSLEYVFPVPVSVEAAETNVRHLYSMFKGYHPRPSDRCGVHIHINAQNDEMEDIFKNIQLYLMFEDLLLTHCGDERTGNTFCLRASDAEWLLMRLIQDKKAGTFSSVLNDGAFKYAALNLAALGRFGSLEYRALGTPSEPQPIIDWMNLLLRIRSYAHEAKDMEEIFSQFSRDGSAAFARRVLGRTGAGLLNLRDYSDLMVESTRRVQLLSHTPLGKSKKKEKSDYQWDRSAFLDSTIRTTARTTTIRAGVNPSWIVSDNAPTDILATPTATPVIDREEIINRIPNWVLLARYDANGLMLSSNWRSATDEEEVERIRLQGQIRQ